MRIHVREWISPTPKKPMSRRIKIMYIWVKSFLYIMATRGQNIWGLINVINLNMTRSFRYTTSIFITIRKPLYDKATDSSDAQVSNIF